MYKYDYACVLYYYYYMIGISKSDPRYIGVRSGFLFSEDSRPHIDTDSFQKRKHPCTVVS